jgi:hypothetical protein
MLDINYYLFLSLFNNVFFFSYISHMTINSEMNVQMNLEQVQGRSHSLF